MSVRALVTAAIDRLACAGVASPATDAEILLAHVLGIPRGGLWLAPTPTEEDLREYETLVARRAAREPLQHLTGTAAFRRLELAVGPGVFVPRPETEVLVGWVLDVLAGCREHAPVVVDLYTGSGAVAAAVTDEAPYARVSAVELDDRAYRYARANLSGRSVDLRHGDVVDAFTGLDGTVDVVVANPPYVPAGAELPPEVGEHDPSVALWSGPDGLGAITVVEQVARRLLRPGGRVGCEHDASHERSAPRVFSAGVHWRDVRDHPDLAGRPRFVTARRVGSGTGPVAP